MNNNGKVYLVGAGPGDPDLITVRGRNLIRQAEVIIYDYLAHPTLLKLARPEAELIYVGKKAGQHSLPQDQINQLLIDKSRQASIVVRLKGGDPFVFGRGGEEALELVRADIKFEVVPGITAGVAVPAYAGIPVTHRDYASDFALITGHEDASRTGTSQIDWPALGSWKGTLAFYMGVKNLSMICTRLRKNGMADDTPAALITWGTTPRQRTVTGTVTTLPDLAVKHGFAPPAMIVIGKVVTLRGQLSWFEQRPLLGKRIVVTRARAQASDLVEQLNRLGAEVLEFPTIRIVEPENLQPMHRAVAELNRYQWVIFTSVNGVDSFFKIMHQNHYDARRFGPVKVCAIGPATAERLRSYGIIADLIPPRFVAESIIEALTELDDLSGQHILLPRAELARPELSQNLQTAGARVVEITAYHTVADEGPREEVLQALRENSIDWITFTSSSTVSNFLEQIDLKSLTEKNMGIASIGPITSATIKKAGLKVDVEAKEYTIPHLVNAICEKELEKKH